MRYISELKWFLDICILHDQEQWKIWLCQNSYIEKITKSFHLNYMKSAHISIILKKYISYEEKVSSQEIHLYQWKIGSILYVITITRPDLACTASKLSEFLQNSSPHYLAVTDQAIFYLYSTKTLTIEFSADVNEQKIFVAASNAAFVNDTATRWSFEDYIFKLFEDAIDWHVTKQKMITTFTTEIELLVLIHAVKKIYWWKCLFRSIQLDSDHEAAVSCDNQQMINFLIKKMMKLVIKLWHVDIHRHWLWQEVQDKCLKINWLSTVKMSADGLIKALLCQKHEIFVKQLDLIDIEKQLECFF